MVPGASFSTNWPHSTVKLVPSRLRRAGQRSGAGSDPVSPGHHSPTTCFISTGTKLVSNGKDKDKQCFCSRISNLFPPLSERRRRAAGRCGGGGEAVQPERAGFLLRRRRGNIFLLLWFINKVDHHRQPTTGVTKSDDPHR